MTACIFHLTVAKLDDGSESCLNHQLPSINPKLVKFYTYKFLLQLADEQTRLTGDTHIAEQISPYVAANAEKMTAFESLVNERAQETGMFWQEPQLFVPCVNGY